MWGHRGDPCMGAWTQAGTQVWGHRDLHGTMEWPRDLHRGIQARSNVGWGGDHCTCSHGATHHPVVVAWRGHRSVPYPVVVLSPLSAPLCPPMPHEELLCAPGMGEYLFVWSCHVLWGCVTVSPPTLSLLPQGGLLDNTELSTWSRARRLSGARARRTRWVGANTLGCSQCPPLSLCPLGAP